MRDTLVTVAIFLLSIFILGIWFIGGAIIRFIWEHRIVTLIVVFVVYLIVTSLFPPDESQ